MASRTLYLQLPPELGGVRFGPFTASCTLGSDPKRAQIVLDPSMGVFPVHATVALAGEGLFTVAPAGKDCKLFLLPAGQPHTWPVTGPVQAKAGDLVILGTPGGPRFVLLPDLPVGQAPTASQIVQTARSTGGEKGLVDSVSMMLDKVTRPAAGSGIAGEINRQIVARSLARPGPMRSVYVVWTKLRSGTLFSPYVIVAIGFALIGLIGTGSVSCTGVLYVVMDVLGLRR